MRVRVDLTRRKWISARPTRFVNSFAPCVPTGPDEFGPEFLPTWVWGSKEILAHPHEDFGRLGYSAHRLGKKVSSRPYQIGNCLRASSPNQPRRTFFQESPPNFSPEHFPHPQTEPPHLSVSEVLVSLSSPRFHMSWRKKSSAGLGLQRKITS